MAKTQISLSAKAMPKKTKEQSQDNLQKSLVEKFTKVFGKGTKARFIDKTGVEYTWPKAEIQLYLHDDGKVGMFVSTDSLPHLEFDGATLKAAHAKFDAYATKCYRIYEKRVNALQEKMKAFKSVFK